MDALKPHIPVRYLTAIEHQLELARLYDKMDPTKFAKQYVSDVRAAATHKAMMTMVSSHLLLANPIYVAPEVADALSDSMADIDHVSLALYPTDAPCQFGFAYIGGDEWPLDNSFTDFTSTCRAVSWAVEPNNNSAWYVLYGRSFQPNMPIPGADDKLQINDIGFYTFGVPLVQAADANAERVAKDGYTRGYLDEAGVAHTVVVSSEDAYPLLFQAQLTALRYLSAIWLFMKQRIAAQSEGHMDRAIRRRLPSAYAGSELVSIVHLRAIDTKRKPPKNSGSKWRMRSIRRAHWHNYWCEGKSARCDYEERHSEPRLEPRFLQATVCGPDDAPLKAGAKLFAVVR